MGFGLLQFVAQLPSARAAAKYFRAIRCFNHPRTSRNQYESNFYIRSTSKWRSNYLFWEEKWIDGGEAIRWSRFQLQQSDNAHDMRWNIVQCKHIWVHFPINSRGSILCCFLFQFQSPSIVTFADLHNEQNLVVHAYDLHRIKFNANLTIFGYERANKPADYEMFQINTNAIDNEWIWIWFFMPSPCVSYHRVNQLCYCLFCACYLLYWWQHHQ